MSEEPRSSAMMRVRSRRACRPYPPERCPPERRGGARRSGSGKSARPNATQPVTRTRTGAWLWPRDPLQTAGRWGGGWGRLVHGNALATTDAMAARMPSRSFFVLDRTTIPVKIKARTNMDNKGCSGVLANIVQGRTGVRNFPQPRSCQTAMNRSCDLDAAPSPKKLPIIQAIDRASREHAAAKIPEPSLNGAIRNQVLHPCSAARKWDCYIRSIHHIASSSQRANRNPGAIQ